MKRTKIDISFYIATSEEPTDDVKQDMKMSLYNILNYDVLDSDKLYDYLQEDLGDIDLEEIEVEIN